MITFLQQHSKRIAIGAIALGLLVLGSRWLLPGAAQPPETPAAFVETNDPFGPPEEDAAPSPTPAPPIVAYISGAVREPDVYTLPPEARIKDLVLAAGGLLKEADAERINLAGRIDDGQHVQVPFQGEATAAPASAAPGEAASATGDRLLNINTASLDDLDQLEGIGKVLAQRIIDYRNANGPFKSVDELGKVKGISATLLAKLAPQLSAQP